MEKIFTNKFTDQADLVKNHLLPEIELFQNKFNSEIKNQALNIIKSAKKYKSHNAFEKLMHEYDLSSNEGIVLMCLAEALLRIPDNKTINDLIEDKIPTGQWKNHIKNDNNLFVNILKKCLINALFVFFFLFISSLFTIPLFILLFVKYKISPVNMALVILSSFGCIR